MPPPRVFVSHSHQENAWCRQFVSKLRQLGYDVWYDEHNLGSGALRDTIDRELLARQHFIVIFSPAALQSHWVKDEMEGAIKLFHQGKMQTFLPVVAARCDVPPSLERYRRIEGPSGASVSVGEAVARVAKILPPVPAIVPPPPPPVTPRPAPTQASPSSPSSPHSFSRRALIVTGVTSATAIAVGSGILYWVNNQPTPRPPPTSDNSFVPVSLVLLGFVGKIYGTVKVIIPPVVSVPSGPFLMGSDPAKDSQAFSDEQPQESITIASGYQIGQYHVTVAEFDLAVQADAVNQPPDNSGITWQTQLGQLDHPVVSVSWFDVVKYCQWLAQVTGDPWRLPTEAEWEKAARGTDGQIYPWGDQWDNTRANTTDGGPGTTTPVGVYANAGDASPYGCHDMAGNAWQWCSSLYLPYPYDPSKSEKNSDTSSVRVLRGGSWVNGSGSRARRIASTANLLTSTTSWGSGWRARCGAAHSRTFIRILAFLLSLIRTDMACCEMM